MGFIAAPADTSLEANCFIIISLYICAILGKYSKGCVGMLDLVSDFSSTS